VTEAEEELYPSLEGARFEIGRVLADTCETLVQTFPRLIAIVLIMAVPLMIWLILGGEPLLVQFAAAFRPEAGGGPNPILAILFVLMALIALLIHAAVSDAAFQHLIGAEGDLVRNLSRAMIASPSVIAAGVFVISVVSFWMALLSLAAGLLAGVLHWTFGLALGIGGVIGLVALLLRWCVLVPAIVIEQTGPFGGFSRSNQLTEGSRWHIFALLLIVYMPQMLVNILLAAAAPMVGPAVITMLNIAISGVFLIFNAVLGVMIYGHLRAVKEGSGIDSLAEVFE